MTEWAIRRPIIYRYLNRPFVDDFFNTGKLRLSSFAAFAKHNDAERKDSGEGAGIIINRDQEGEGQTFWAVMRQGLSAYVLCGSTQHSNDLSQNFATDSGFRINDTTSFGCAVSRMIVGFSGGLEGACTYSDQKVVHRKAGRIELDDMQAGSGQQNLDMGKMVNAIGALAGDDLFFMKKANYQHQAEYRLIWCVQGNAADFIEIACPEAVQYCTRFEDL